MGLDHRVRWRLREQDDGSTKVTFRLSYQSPGTVLGTIADYVSSPIVDNSLRASLERLKAEIEGEDMGENDSPGLLEKARLTVGQGLHSVKTLAEAGLIKPERPDKTIRALLQIQRWGYTPAAGYAANASRYGNDDAIIDELGHLTSPRSTTAQTASRTRGPTPASSRATRSESCAATTATSSMRSSRRRRWA